MNLNFRLDHTKMNLMTNLYSMFTGDSKSASANIANLGNHQIITLASKLNKILDNVSMENVPDVTRKTIQLPRIVTVGTQSSGKSSVLKNFTSLNIFPESQKMETRVPAETQLIKITNPKEARVEFGNYTLDGTWVVDKSISIPDKNDTTLPVNAHADFSTRAQEYIRLKTREITKDEMNISETPINIKVYSCDVLDISFVDLPGLILLSREDEGQPADMKEQIERLVEKYIKLDNTIILLVMQSREDLETDVGMAFVKKYSKVNDRILGVLTKPDLMNEDSHVGDQLLGKVSKNLSLKYGYFVVKNKPQHKLEELHENLENKSVLDEKTYFSNHPEYKKSQYKDKLGYESLIACAGNILITAIKEALPEILINISKLETHIIEKLSLLGSGIPTTHEGKLSEIYRYINKFSDRLLECIESRGTNPNIGKSLRFCFDKYEKQIDEINPFRNNTIYNDTYFKDIVASFEGYHMSCPTSTVELIEKSITDEKHKPIQLLKNPSHQCVKEINATIINAFEVISNEDTFTTYPLITLKIRSIITEKLLVVYSNKVQKRIDELLKFERDYINTSNEDFKKSTQKVFQEEPKLDSNKGDVMYRNDFKLTGIVNNVKSVLNHSSEQSPTTSIKHILELYFNIVKDNLKHNVPKMIMSLIIRELERNIREYLYTKFTKGTEPLKDNIDGLFKEDPSLETKRKYYSDLKEKIDTIRKIMQTV
jgi:hypothetical protein